MVTVTDLYPLAVDQVIEILWVDVGNREQNRASMELGVTRAVDGDTGDLLRLFHRIIDQSPRMGPYPIHAELGQVVDGRTQADPFGDARRAGLELPREVVPCRLVESDPPDHVAPSEEGRHRLEQRPSGPEDADPRRTAHLVATEGVEVDPELLDVDRHVWHRLGTVDQHQRAGPVRRLGHRLDWIDGPERVRLVGDGEQPHTLELAVQLLELEQAVIIDAQKAERGVNLLGQQLPGYQIAVMLPLSQEDAVAGPDVCPAPAVANQVDGLGRVSGEDHFFWRGRTDEGRHPLPCRLVGRSRFLTDGVNAAMGIGVVAPVVVVHGVDHHRGLLGGSRAVEVDQWLAVDTPTQDRKVGPRGFGVQRASLDHAGCPSFIRSATETDSSVDVMVPCSCSQKACAEQGVSAWVHSPGPPPSARQLTGASDPSRLRTMSAIEIASGRRASAYPPLTPIRLVINPSRRSWPAICSR